MSKQDPCRNQVSKFEQAIAFVRLGSGNRAAEEFKEKVLPAKLEAQLLSDQGYCGLARYLKAKRLID